MRTIRMLTWFTQLGLSAATPLVVFILAAVWLRDRFQLGDWVVWVGVLLGVYGAISGFRYVVAAMRREAEAEAKEKPAPPTSFNDHS